MKTANRDWLLHLPTLFMGLTFLCSALFKAIGLRTFGITVEEFCAFLGLHAFYGKGLWLAAALCTGELLLGISAFLPRQRHYTVWLFLTTMAFFTYLTGINLASPYGQIESCGYFGEVIHLTPMESFAKNVILLVMSMVALLIYNIDRMDRMDITYIKMLTK